MKIEVERQHLEFAKQHTIRRCPPGPTFHVNWGFVRQRAGHNFLDSTEQDIISRYTGTWRRHMFDITGARLRKG